MCCLINFTFLSPWAYCCCCCHYLSAVREIHFPSVQHVLTQSRLSLLLLRKQWYLFTLVMAELHGGWTSPAAYYNNIPHFREAWTWQDQPVRYTGRISDSDGSAPPPSLHCVCTLRVQCAQQTTYGSFIISSPVSLEITSILDTFTSNSNNQCQCRRWWKTKVRRSGWWMGVQHVWLSAGVRVEPQACN